MANITTTQPSGITKLNGILSNPTMKRKFEDILADNASSFMASIIELYQSDNQLNECDPNEVVLEALKGATLKLPIQKSLGFGYLVVYKSGGKPHPQFQPGYKAFVQLAQRSGQYSSINADCVYEGEVVTTDRISGNVQISGEPTSDKVIGYVAHFSLLNGFSKAIYWNRDKMLAFAKRYSKAYQYDIRYNKQSSLWSTDFDSMGKKTVLKHLISKFGPMSVEMAKAIETDNSDRVEAEVTESANKTPITIESEFTDEPTDTSKGTPLPFDEPPVEEVPDDPGF